MVTTKQSTYDILVIGAGPAGLSFARTLADTKLKICLLDKQPLAMLAQPPLDGRDIALTHDSIALMKTLKMFEHLPEHDISPIHKAHVYSGRSSYFLGFDVKETTKEALGYFVPNNAIRKAAYQSIQKTKTITIRDKVEVVEVITDEHEGRVTLSTGEVLTASLVVAADSRYSTTREKMGIPVSRTDFKRSAIVCRMTHEKDHGKTAQECFFDDWTLAILPLQGKKSSIVITLPTEEAKEVMALSEKAFNARLEQNLGDRLGAMRLTGQRYTYPLVAIYAARFTDRRFALMGDAAVGMHPVTAHGYNLGLAGAALLAQEIRKALALGLDIGDSAVLKAYDRAHRQGSAFLYYGTNALVKVYTDNRPSMMALRAAGLRIASHLPPFKRYVTKQLTGKAA